MSRFFVSVRRIGYAPLYYFDFGTDSGAVHIEALDRHGVCGVTVKPN